MPSIGRGEESEKVQSDLLDYADRYMYLVPRYELSYAISKSIHMYYPYPG